MQRPKVPWWRKAWRLVSNADTAASLWEYVRPYIAPLVIAVIVTAWGVLRELPDVLIAVLFALAFAIAYAVFNLAQEHKARRLKAAAAPESLPMIVGNQADYIQALAADRLRCVKGRIEYALDAQTGRKDPDAWYEKLALRGTQGVPFEDLKNADTEPLTLKQKTAVQIARGRLGELADFIKSVMENPAGYDPGATTPYLHRAEGARDSLEKLISALGGSTENVPAAESQVFAPTITQENELMPLQRAATKIYSEFGEILDRRAPITGWKDPELALGMSARLLVGDGLIPVWGVYPPATWLKMIPDEDARTYWFADNASYMYDQFDTRRRYTQLQIDKRDFGKRLEELRAEYGDAK